MVNASVPSNFYNGLTISLWFKAAIGTPSSQRQNIIHKYDCSPTCAGMVVEITSDGLSPTGNAGTLRTALLNYSTGDSQADAYSATEYIDDVWHHVALVWDSPNIRQYVDGDLVGDSATIITDFDAPTDLMGVGALRSPYFSSPGDFFNGQIDDIGVWSRALDQCELEQLQTAGEVTLPLNDVTIDGSTTICDGETVSLTASPGDTYLWSNGETTQTIEADATDDYSVVVTNGQHCAVASQTVSVVVNPLPAVSATAQGATTFCDGGSVSINATGDGSFLWSNNQSGPSIVVTETGDYSVTATDNGCSATSSPISVTVIPNPMATISANGPLTICDGNEVVLTASDGDSWAWIPSGTNQSISVSQAGSYSVTVTENGCSTTSATTMVTVNSNPSVSLSSIDDVCVNAQPFPLDGGSPSGGSFAVNGNADTDFHPGQLGVGNQTVVYEYTDGNGCSGSAQTTVSVVDVPTVNLSGLNSSYTLSDNPVSLSGSPAGGVFMGTGVEEGVFDPAEAGLGTHSVTYTYVDNQGCIGTSGLCTTVDLAVGTGGQNEVSTGGSEVYPNPGSGLFTLVTEAQGVVSFEVFDSKGASITSESYVSHGVNQKFIDLTDYSEGVYLIQVTTLAGSETMKLIKE